MRRILFLYIGLYFELVNFVYSNSHSVKFLPSPGIRYRNYGNILNLQNVIQCCLACMSRADCLAASYHANEKQCSLGTSAALLTNYMVYDNEWLTYYPTGNLCPSGWTNHYTSCYLLQSEWKTWLEAKRSCENRGSHLAYVTSKEENDFLEKLIPVNGPEYFIGGTDERIEGQWEWLNGARFDYKYWKSGQPDNDGNEDYAEIISSSNYQWNDADAGKKSYSICEKDIQFR